jgi:hypothetical protein
MKRIQVVMLAGMAAGGWSICALATAAWNGQAQPHSQTETKSPPASSLHQLYGTVRRVEGSQLTIEARDGRSVQVDATAAIQSYRSVALPEGSAVEVSGSYDEKGVLHAQTIQRAKSSSAAGAPDR